MTTLEPYPFPWLADAGIDEMVAIQDRLDDMATSAREKLLGLTEPAADRRPGPRQAAPAESPSFDRDDPVVQLLSLHEAAHCVIARALGLTVSGVELVRSVDGVLGHAWIKGLENASAFQRAVVLLAGPVGEARARAGRWGDPLAFLRGSAAELAEARDLLGDGLRSALEHTRDLVCGCWGRIESVARRLLRDGSLDERLGRVA